MFPLPVTRNLFFAADLVFIFGMTKYSYEGISYNPLFLELQRFEIEEQYYVVDPPPEPLEKSNFPTRGVACMSAAGTKTIGLL